MPMNPQQFAGLMGGLQTAGTAGQGLFGWITARKQKAHELKLYDMQKKDAVNFWNMENLYNSPEAQMKRLKAAGLNPHLIYGNGATATGGNINAPDIKPSDQAGNMMSSMQGLFKGNMLTDIYDLKIKNAQADLLTEQALTQQSTRDLQAAETNLKSLLANKTTLEISLGRDTYQSQVEQARQQVRKTSEEILNIRSGTRLNNQNTIKSDIETQNLVQKKIIDWEQHKASLSKIYQDIVESKQRVNASQAEMSLIPAKLQNIQSDTKLKDAQEALTAFDHFLASLGRNRNDSFVSQVLKGLLFNTALTPKDVEEAEKKVKDYLQNKAKYRLMRK